MTPQTVPHPLETRPLPADEPDQIDLLERATDLEKSTREFIQANPTVALLGALAIGFVVGRLVMR
jgi:ElaB/YqjD/DUF883 family membrane-anchored ribosome-binding protein